MHRIGKLGSWAVVSVLAAASVAAAQVPDATAAAGPQAESVFHVQALGSVALATDRPHVAGGALVQLGRGAVSAVALGMLGTGGDYESRLVGGGIGARLTRLGPADLTGIGGYGRYREEGWSGIRRDAGGILLGGLAVLDLGGIALSAGMVHLVGRYDGDDVSDPFRFHVPRVTLGLGF